jgi:hypothetical protein
MPVGIRKETFLAEFLLRFRRIPNPLCAADNTLLFFNDGKKAFLKLASALKEV